ncbi:MAG: hypothetical protein HDQ99_00935 [Lachnospiraceae bacterium]|nr:hypothetical protein [Lachnospiraceae bacterium]
MHDDKIVSLYFARDEAAIRATEKKYGRCPHALEIPVLSSLTCYGSDRWDIINYGSADAATDGTGPLDAVRLGRYLSLVTEYGNEIDSLKYTAVSDMFYEFSGIAYNTLSEEQAQKMCEIFGIETE